jgi:DNA ligase (NAD+)
MDNNYMVLTPVALLVPVVVGGVTISKATLHNPSILYDLDVREGDIVYLERAGDVIPHIIKADIAKRSTQVYLQGRVILPNICPVCQHVLTIECDESLSKRITKLACPNYDCPARLLARLEHFVGREAMNIRGLGPSLLWKLVQASLVKTSADLYVLTKEIVSGAGIGPKIAENVVSAIQASKNPSLDKFIYALGIENIGRRASKTIADAVHNNVRQFLASDYQFFANLSGIGSSMATEIVTVLSDAKRLDEISQLIKNGVIQEDSVQHVGSLKKDSVNPAITTSFDGVVVALTGRMQSYTRDQARKEIELRGGIVSSDVTKKVHVLVYGEDAGGKLALAKKYGIFLADEMLFQQFLQTHISVKDYIQK